MAQRPRRSELAALFERPGIRTERSDNVRRAIWYKLWGNMTMNPLSALTLATADRILADEELKPFILACMAEAAEIGAAIGCPIGESGEDRMAVTARLGAFKTSMLQDVEAGRTIELEALVGAPREIGRRVGIADAEYRYALCDDPADGGKPRPALAGGQYLARCSCRSRSAPPRPPRNERPASARRHPRGSCASRRSEARSAPCRPC